MNPRVRALMDLNVADAREVAGLHTYDGAVQDLSPDSIRQALARVGGGTRLADPVEEAHLAAFEAAAGLVFGDLETHRSNPLLHIMNLDVACYDRDYAPAEVRAEAKRRHLLGWPDAVGASLDALDQVSAPVAEGLLNAAEGLGEGLAESGLDEQERARAEQALQRFVSHLRQAAEHGDPDPAIGGAALAGLMGVPEAMQVDLASLADRCDAERDRLRAMLDDACARIRPGVPAERVVHDLHADHPDAGGVLAEAARQVDEVIAFTRDHQLAPHVDGECYVKPSPPSRRWAMAMMAPAAPYEDDGPSVYFITPPDPSWPETEQQQWLEVFSATTLPGITAHEVAPGHFAHGRSLRRADGDVRRALQSIPFAEGWAHYAEELFVEEGFRSGDPRFAVGVALEALIRVTRLAVAIGLHTRALMMAEAIRRFETDALLGGSAARSEAVRATFDPGYGCYTFGKLEISSLRERARRRWGSGYTHARFHRELLALGSPPLGLMESILDSP